MAVKSISNYLKASVHNKLEHIYRQPREHRKRSEKKQQDSTIEACFTLKTKHIYMTQTRIKNLTVAISKTHRSETPKIKYKERKTKHHWIKMHLVFVVYINQEKGSPLVNSDKR